MDQVKKIKIIKIEDFKLGFNRLKDAKLELAGDLEKYEYRKAEFKVENLKYFQINPSAYYALKSKLEFQREFYRVLTIDCKINLFELPGIVYFEFDNKMFGLVPPIIEIYEETDGHDSYALQDGIHRILLGKELDLPQECIFIQNKAANRDYLPYSYTNSWDEVKIY